MMVEGSFGQMDDKQTEAVRRIYTSAQGLANIVEDLLNVSKIEQGGSWLFTFEHATNKEFITVEKGSICVNGISLTVVDSKINQFSVAIIPYTYEHTNLSNIEVGNHVNLEFDILGKYVAKLALFR